MPRPWKKNSRACHQFEIKIDGVTCLILKCDENEDDLYMYCGALKEASFLKHFKGAVNSFKFLQWR